MVADATIADTAGFGKVDPGHEPEVIAMALNLPAYQPVDYGAQDAEMREYRAAGTQRALNLGNRGPIRYTPDGNVAPEILEAYLEYGFYVFEGVVDARERAELEADLETLVDHLPAGYGEALDHAGRPAIGSDNQAPTVQWARPLSDPLGGTDKANGRHPAKMFEPKAPQGAPKHVVQLVLGALQFSPAFLRLYAHPDLLRVAAAVNGEDFTPFNEAIWIKYPGLGGSVAWHQDGTTHWDSPDLDAGTHGFNFMAQLYGCDAENGLWVVPGSHRIGKADIKGWVEDAGSDRLPDAVPLICGPGDVVICNRQAVHGSFANTSPNVRVTFNFGFHRKASVLGATGGGIHNQPITYDEDRIRQRSEVLALALSARRAHRPDEAGFDYAPFADGLPHYDDQAFLTLKDYNLLDLGI